MGLKLLGRIGGPETSVRKSVHALTCSGSVEKNVCFSAEQGSEEGNTGKMLLARVVLHLYLPVKDARKGEEGVRVTAGMGDGIGGREGERGLGERRVRKERVSSSES